jgi:hypothetical protein
MCLFSLEFFSCTMIKCIHIDVEVLQPTKTLMYFLSIDEHINIMVMLSHSFHSLYVVATSKVSSPSIIPSSFFAQKNMVIWNFHNWKLILLNFFMYLVATLALGSRPKQRVARLQAKREPRESCQMLPGV